MIAVTLHKTIILGVRNLSCARPGAFTLAPRGQFWNLVVTLGDLEQQEGHVRVRNQIFSDFGKFRVPILRAFWVQVSFFGRVCFKVTFCTDFESKSLLSS